jgi:hypothetical protein
MIGNGILMDHYLLVHFRINFLLSPNPNLKSHESRQRASTLLPMSSALVQRLPPRALIASGHNSQLL